MPLPPFLLFLFLGTFLAQWRSSSFSSVFSIVLFLVFGMFLAQWKLLFGMFIAQWKSFFGVLITQWGFFIGMMPIRTRRALEACMEPCWLCEEYEEEQIGTCCRAKRDWHDSHVGIRCLRETRGCPRPASRGSEELRGRASAPTSPPRRYQILLTFGKRRQGGRRLAEWANGAGRAVHGNLRRLTVLPMRAEVLPAVRTPRPALVPRVLGRR